MMTPLTSVIALLLGSGSEGLAPPFRVLDGKNPIDVDVGHAAPIVADLDGDGLAEFLVGQFGGGKLRIYKNLGTAKEPRFEGFTWFKTGEQEGSIPSG